MTSYFSSSTTRATHRIRTAANSAAYLLPHLRPGLSVLDIGCGPGTITVDFARLISPGTITAVDYEQEPVDETLALAQQEGLTNVVGSAADVHKLPFDDETFDVVHVSQVLQHVSDPVQALREMRRVVKRGGIVAARETAEMVVYPPLEGIKLFWDVYAQVARSRGGNPHPGSRIHVWANEAGFAVDEITKSAGTWCYATPEDREAFGSANRQRVDSKGGFGEAALKAGLCTREDAEKMKEGWDRLIQDEQGWITWLHGEIICRKT